MSASKAATRTRRGPWSIPLPLPAHRHLPEYALVGAVVVGHLDLGEIDAVHHGLARAISPVPGDRLMETLRELRSVEERSHFPAARRPQVQPYASGLLQVEGEPRLLAPG